MKEAQRRASTRDFGPSSFFWRLGVSLVLVLLTYNPTSFSYYDWLFNSLGNGGLGPEHFVAGVALVIGWTILIVATQKSLGTVGFVLGAALIGGFVWWLTSLGLIRVGSVSALSWVSLICLAVLLAVGLSWSHVWRRLTGQYEVDDSDG